MHHYDVHLLLGLMTIDIDRCIQRDEERHPQHKFSETCPLTSDLRVLGVSVHRDGSGNKQGASTAYPQCPVLAATILVEFIKPAAPLQQLLAALQMLPLLCLQESEFLIQFPHGLARGNLLSQSPASHRERSFSFEGREILGPGGGPLHAVSTSGAPRGLKG